MENQTDEVKAKTDIVSIIGERVELKKAGSNYKGLCPFHSEKTPSFMVSPELQIFKCFGCGKSGDVFTFLEEYEGMEFYEALNYLADRVGIKIKPFEGEKKGIKERLIEINSLISRFYQYVLLKHPAGKKALGYLTSDRGLKLSTIEKFHLGYSPNQQFALKKYIVERKKVSISELEQVGVVYKKPGLTVDRFRGRVIFPLFDHRGNIIGFAGRILPDDVRAKEVAKYINTPETLLYHKSKVLYGLNDVRQEIKKEKEAVLVEGELDMISSWQAGIKNVVAIKGSSLTEEQIKLLSRFAKKIVFALDTDFAGNEAARRGVIMAEKEGFEVRVADLGDFKDPDEIARKDPGEYRKKLKGAVGIWDFIIDSIFQKFSGQTGEEKAKISKELIPMLATIEDKIVQAHYVAQVAKKLQVPLEAVSEELNNLINQKKSGKPKIEVLAGTPANKTRREILEERFMAIALRTDPSYLKNKEVLKFLITPFAKKIILELANFSGAKDFDISLFVKNLPSELTDHFTDLLLKEIDGLEKADSERLKKELLLIEKEIRILGIKDELAFVAGKIHNLESSKEKNDLSTTEQEFSKLTKKLFELEARN